MPDHSPTSLHPSHNCARFLQVLFSTQTLISLEDALSLINKLDTGARTDLFLNGWLNPIVPPVENCSLLKFLLSRASNVRLPSTTGKRYVVSRTCIVLLLGPERFEETEILHPTMTKFDTKRLPAAIDEIAPDGSNVRVLLGLKGGLMGHYELAPGRTSSAVTNQTIEEIWFFLSGRGEMWRKQQDREEIVAVAFGVCVTIPLGTHFQIRALGQEPLIAVGVTIPPWPGQGEAILVPGKWNPPASLVDTSR